MTLLAWIAFAVWWSSQRLFNAPSLLQSISQCVVVHSLFMRPFFEAQCTTVVSKHLRGAFLGRSCWRGQCFFERPLIQPNSQRAVSDADSLGPIKQAECLAFIGQHSRLATILRLLFLGGPATVLLGVWSIWIGVSVNRRVWKWLRTHVCQKVLKGLSPSVADRDSSPAIEFVVRCIRVVAASFHRAPNAIFWRARLSLDRITRRHDSTPLKVGL